jgi:hypothetical protein
MSIGSIVRWWPNLELSPGINETETEGSRRALTLAPEILRCTEGVEDERCDLDALNLPVAFPTVQY